MNSTRKHLSIFTWNIQGLYDKEPFGISRNKLENEQIRKILADHEIVCLLETHLDQAPNQNILPGYNLFHSFRRLKHSKARRTYGGVTVAVRNNLLRGITRVHSSSDDTIWLKLNRKFFSIPKDIYLCAVYLVPEGSSYLNWTNSDPFSLLEFDISKYKDLGQILLTGDFNARTANLKDYIDSELDSCDSLPLPKDYICNTFNIERNSNMDKIVNNYGRNLMDLCIASDVIVLNGRTKGDMLGKFTCYEYNGQSVVDYHVVSKTLFQNVIVMRVHNLTEYSDHTPISLLLNLETPIIDPTSQNLNSNTSHMIPSFKWNEESKDRYQFTFSQPDIQNEIITVLKKDNENTKDFIDNIVNDTSNIYINVAKKSLALRKQKKNCNLQKPWYTNNCLLIRKNLLIVKKLRETYPHNREIREDFNAIKRLYRQKIRKSKKDYRNVLAQKMFEAIKTKNYTEFWNTFNSTKKRKSQSSNIESSVWINHFKTLNAEPETNEMERRNIHDNISECQTQSKCIDILDHEIQEQEILKVIKKLKNNKSPGIDRITNEMIKCTKSYMVPVLKKIFNLILNSGHFPSEWKKGIIVPIYKSGPTDDPNNYRGITLTSALGKVFTSILNSRLRTYMEDNSLISDLQFGSRENRRTTDALFILKSAIDWHKKKSVPLYAAFIDFKKAFDMVWHDALLLKLSKIGIGGNFIKVIMDLYSGISSCVKIENKRTEYFSCLKGVRQGDGLSSTLYNLFINDIVDVMHMEDSDPFKIGNTSIGLLLYADDVVILSSSKNGLQKSLDKLGAYTKKWKLPINTSKSKILQFGKNKFEKFTFGEHEIETAKHIKYLGLVITSNGAFRQAINTLCKQASKSLWPLYGMFGSYGIDNIQSKLLLFDNLVKPIILYGSEVWHTDILPEEGLASIFKTNNKFYDAERLQLRFLKQALKVPVSTTNLAVWSETGKYPIVFDVVKQQLKYFVRLESMPETAILSKVHRELKMDSPNYTFNMVRKTFDAINLTIPHDLKDKRIRTKFLNLIAPYLNEFVDEIWYSILSTNDTKLRNYKLIKHCFEYESYLDTIHDPVKRAKLTRLRLSCHELEIERGRYKGKHLEERLCTNCNLRKIEDEIHFLVECPKYANKRKSLFEFLATVYPFASQLQDNKLIYKLLMSTKNFDLQKQLASFIFYIYKLRT